MLPASFTNLNTNQRIALQMGWINDVPMEAIADANHIPLAAVREFYATRDAEFFERYGHWPTQSPE